ncbi:MAG: S8 family serine peptidase [candidate division Zixibacteria bacterium]|nr:S8 family serine peptidase [candidate division Zixibacteria bacterium]
MENKCAARMIRLPGTLVAVAVLYAGWPPSVAASRLTGTDLRTVAQPVVIQKAEQPLKALADKAVETQDEVADHFWLFFTDKGVFNTEQFDSAASEVRLSRKVLKRRARVGLEHVVFADLPLNPAYLKAVTNRGGKLRRLSKWLNAASFEIPLERIHEIAALPGVACVRPVMKFKNEPVASERLTPDLPTKKAPERTQLEPPIDYGFAADQLAQINVPAVHQLGFNGQGVTLAILDTGFRKSHEVFAQHYLEGRVLAEWDFLNNDGNTANESSDGDLEYQWDHGTITWSVAGGYKDGYLYGPAYKADFLLAKTDNAGSDTPVEEDNWVAALEWADSLGADVISSSLSYKEWDTGTNYTYEDMDGATATTSIAASTAAALGIVVCNSMGNEGPALGTLRAPADACSILAVGSVNLFDYIASSSSRGPSYDGRPKPEVCARGVNTACATATNDISYGTSSGTSLATPLVAGAACVLIQARPSLDPPDIRRALMETAGMADSPDSTTYGHGIINLLDATGWGAAFTADVTLGEAPLDVQFAGTSALPADAWIWSLGDDDSAFVQNPQHIYSGAGVYDVSLMVISDADSVTLLKENYIIALGDTLGFETDSAWADHPCTVSVNLANYQQIEQMILPFRFGSEPHIRLDSVVLGTRTAHFESLVNLAADSVNSRYSYSLKADDGGGSPALAEGSGEILRVYCTPDAAALGGLSSIIDSAQGTVSLNITGEYAAYVPRVIPGAVSTRYVLRGDANASGKVNISDVTFLISYLFGIPTGPAPVTIQSGDANASSKVNVADITYLVAYLFGNGPEPPEP